MLHSVVGPEGEGPNYPTKSSTRRRYRSLFTFFCQEPRMAMIIYLVLYVSDSMDQQTLWILINIGHTLFALRL